MRLFFPLLYGTDPGSVNVDLVHGPKAGFKIIMGGFSPANGLLELFPAMEYVPGFAWASKKAGAALLEACLGEIDNRLEAALRNPSWNFTQALYERRPAEMSRKTLCIFMMELELTGVMTIALSTCNIVKMAATHPGEMRRVQAELDTRVGSDRLPTVEDLPHLYHLHAFIEECSRLHPVFPLGVPHAPTQEDEYMGYRIPHDAIILPFQYGLNTDEATYKDPMAFHPQRWIDDPSLPPPAAFGNGKRLCPGQPFVSDIVALSVATTFWGFALEDLGVTRDSVSSNCLLVQEIPLSHVRHICRSSGHLATIEREARKKMLRTGPWG
ncbi:cytochrome P450 [Aspergillus homomorphus CBS 101889]|uniref:Cytochrome P450 n=1 Tax=Aspergillus homomorphus (strain CBS 101889) TaxID=1450537 RepID=A0A395I255_ASPHC|nr:cytochrome P450 [Aspergillus homomorphus CBS 101889]RAL13733.1 cytochrome P450 [Aspergillus homomorphus CBS 101889]